MQTPASRHRGRLQRRATSSVSRIRFSPALCRQRGWGGPGTGSVEDFLQLGWTLGDAQATVSKKKKNLWILYAEVGRSICIIAEHKGMRSSLVPIVAGWVHIGCLEPASLKTCHHPAPTANNQGLFADLKRSSLVFMGKYLWL